MSELTFGMPQTDSDQAGNETTEWPNGPNIACMTDGRVKIGRPGSQLRGEPKGVQVQQFAKGTNPTTHFIAAFDTIENDN